jgi:hypothetical protein
MNYLAGWKLVTVNLRRGWREHVDDYDVEASGEEALRQSAGVLGGESRLSGSMRASPRRVGASHHQLPHIIDIDESCSCSAFSEQPSGGGLAYGRPSGKHQRPQDAIANAET